MGFLYFLYLFLFYSTWLTDGLTEEEVKECIDNGKIKCAVFKALKDVKAFIAKDIIFYDLTERDKLNEFIDRKIAEVKGDKSFRYSKEIIEAQSPPSEGVNGEEFEKWLREGDKK